jgi:hypothetical protein
MRTGGSTKRTSREWRTRPKASSCSTAERHSFGCRSERQLAHSSGGGSMCSGIAPE